MDSYFNAPPRPVTLHAPSEPVATPIGNRYQENRSAILGFWSVRGLWAEEYWRPQSESASAAQLSNVQPPSYVPYGSMANVVNVVMASW